MLERRNARDCVRTGSEGGQNEECVHDLGGGKYFIARCLLGRPLTR
jgi:hypothetical protein